MTNKLPIRIATLLLAYDYGRRERGPSGEKSCFYPSLCDVAQEVCPLWLEDNGYPDDLDGLQRRIRDFVESSRPDVVFTMLMRHEIADATLDFMRERAFVVNWFCDDQWRFENFSRFMAPHLSGVMTADSYAIPKYQAMSVKAVWVPWGVGQFVDEKRIDENQYDYDVSFVGGKDRSRRWFIQELQKRVSVPIVCFGSGWPRGRLSEEKVREVMLRSKMNLNLSNSRNNDVRFVLSSPGNALSFLRAGKVQEQVKARNIEIPAAGGFELSAYAPGLEGYFRIGEEIDVFTSPDDGAMKINYYLAEDARREAIKRKGYERAKKEYGLSEVLRQAFRSLGIM